jgi:hypothetical protein
LSEEGQNFLQNLFNTIDFNYYKKNDSGVLETDGEGKYKTKSNEEIDKDLNQSMAIAQQLTEWAAVQT